MMITATGLLILVATASVAVKTFAQTPTIAPSRLHDEASGKATPKSTHAGDVLTWAHPGFFFDTTDVASLQTKILSGRSKEAYAIMKSRADSYLSLQTSPYSLDGAKGGRTLSVQLFTLALTGYLTGDSSYTDKAVELLCAVASQSGVSTFVSMNIHLAVGDGAHAYAVAYDMLEPFMDASQKALVEAEIYSFGQWLYDHSFTDPFGEDVPKRLAHNHNAVAHGGMGLCALVLGDAAPAEWTDRATSKIRGYFDYAVDANGCAYEGMSYLAYGMQGAVPYAVALERQGGVDIINEKTVTSLIPQYYVWQLLPKGSEGVTINQSDTMMKPSGSALHLIAKYQDSVGLWGWDRIVGQLGDASYGSGWMGYGASLPYVILWDDPLLVTQTPIDAGLGLSKVFPRGQASLRDGWDDEDSFVSFTSGTGWAGCWNHADENTFTFFANGEKFAIDPGAGYGGTNHHNAIMVDGLGQDWTAGWELVTGDIVAHKEMDDASYVRGDATAAYTNFVGAQKAVRQVLYVRGEQPYVIITDDFEVDDSSQHLFEWRLHTDNANNLVVNDTSKGAHIEGSNAIAGAYNKCVIKCLSPGTYSLSLGDVTSVYKEMKVSTSDYNPRFVIMMMTIEDDQTMPTITKTGDADDMSLTIAFANGVTDVIDLSLQDIDFARDGVCEMYKGRECLTPVAQSEIIYQNDLGTVDQRTVGGTGDWDIDNSTTRNLLWNESGWGERSLDLDGDGLHGGIMQDGLGQIVWTKQITAPAGKTFENIRVLAHGHGWKNYIGLELRLTPGGTADYSKTAKGDAFKAFPETVPEDSPLGVNASGDPAYTGISSFYLTVIVDENGVFSEQDYKRAYLSDVTVYADVD